MPGKAAVAQRKKEVAKKNGRPRRTMSAYAEHKRQEAQEALRMQLYGMGLITGIQERCAQLVTWADEELTPEPPHPVRVQALGKAIDTDMKFLNKVLPDLKEVENKGEAGLTVNVFAGTYDPQRLGTKDLPGEFVECTGDGD